MAKRILVVDDDFEQRDLYVDLFEENGFDTISAVDGLEGLEKALAEKPDLVFSGIAMPRMDGYELIHNMRKNIVSAQTPVILFSHLGREEDRQKAASLPYVTFMIKGMEGPPVVLKKVKELIGQPGEKTPKPKPETIKISGETIKPTKEVKAAPAAIEPPRFVEPKLPKNIKKPKIPKKNPEKIYKNRDRAGTGMIIV